jgi:hypothetical protein
MGFLDNIAAFDSPRYGQELQYNEYDVEEEIGALDASSSFAIGLAKTLESNPEQKALFEKLGAQEYIRRWKAAVELKKQQESGSVMQSPPGTKFVDQSGRRYTIGPQGQPIYEPTGTGKASPEQLKAYLQKVAANRAAAADPTPAPSLSSFWATPLGRDIASKPSEMAKLQEIGLANYAAQLRQVVPEEVAKKLGPKLNQIMAMLKHAKLQTEATNEHNTINNTMMFRRKVLDELSRVIHYLPANHPIQGTYQRLRSSLGLL